MAARSSSSAAAAAAAAAAPAFQLTWTPSSLAAARPTTAADLAALSSRFRVTIPPVLARLLQEHGGEQPSERCNTLWAQNVQSGAWRRERLGPIYPAAAAAEADEESMADRAGMGFDLASVNELFLEEPEDEEEQSAQSKKSSKASKKKPAAAAAAASSKPLLPFFAFAECLSSGFVLALDTSSGVVMLLDLSGRKGPWIAGESAEHFCARLQQGPELKASAKGEQDEAAEEEQDQDSDMEGGEAEAEADEEDGEDGAAAGAADDGDDQGFCCDVCLAELPSSLVRFHCDVCECYDLCAQCMAVAEKQKKAAAAAAASSSSSAAAAAKKKGRTTMTKEHPPAHTFTRIEPMEDEADEDEEQ